MTDVISLRDAVKGVLLAGAASSTALSAQQATAAEDSNAVLEQVVVTGSRISRVDAESANPVQIIDQESIAQSGVSSAGELISRIPAIAGAATNAQVNNGGGFGEANVELRGLDAKRTLVLVDGRRLGLVGFTGDATDVNQIPLALIERVEVLKEGAGAIYGSDAIGGVVNFITRKNVEGLELNVDYGQTTESDGEHYSASAMFGTSTDKMNFIVGGTYTKQEAVSAGDREFSRFALYLYGGSAGVTRGGSSRTPTGRIFLPAGLFETTTVPQFDPAAPASRAYDCLSTTSETNIAADAMAADPLITPAEILAGTQISVTRTGAGTSPGDYRCFAGASDRYNYQPLNLILTPQERTAVFTKLNYQVNDYVELYATFINNRTRSGFQIAPLPFDAQVDDVVLSANSIYNPFGIDFGGISGANPNFLLRLSAIGNRRSETTSDSKALNAGARGSLFDDAWTWDLNATTTRLDQVGTTYGYLLKGSLQAALGPSFIDSSGNPTCGTPATPISGCIPVNFFNPTAAGQAAAINSISANYNQRNIYSYEALSLDITGKLAELPGGDLQAAFGVEYNSREGSYKADSIVQATAPLYLQCQLANEACTGNSVGDYNSKQVYVELYIPLLKDLPAVHSLALDLGGRYSDYSLFDSETKGEVKFEYRPISSLLVRGTYSQVFRVPTIVDLFASPVNTSVTFNDPCVGLTAAMVTANPNLSLACQGVPTNGTFAQANGQITGLNVSNPNLAPETGDVKTIGFVYDPQFVEGLSLEVDYWDVTVKDLITTVDSNFSIAQCIATGSPQFCSLVTRYTSGAATGQILVFQQPAINLGELHTKGIDFAIRYALEGTPIGNFNFSLDATRIGSYEVDLGGSPIEVVGTYDRQFGNYAQWRGTVGVGWAMADFDALLSARYLDSIVLRNPSVTGVQDDFVTPYPDLAIPSATYLDLVVGYTLPTDTKIRVGVTNLTDEQPPILYQNNVTNGNTDVQNYDTIGRRWWISVSQKF